MGIAIALITVAAIAYIVYVLVQLDADPSVTDADAFASRLPNPTARDQHAVTGSTLTRAPVPTW